MIETPGDGRQPDKHGWKVQLKERFVSLDGSTEELFVLKGPTYPCEFYAGPIISNMLGAVTPRFNATSFYHRTEDEALTALIEMRERSTKRQT